MDDRDFKKKRVHFFFSARYKLLSGRKPRERGGKTRPGNGEVRGREI